MLRAISLIVAMGWASGAYAATFTAASCNQVDVQAAINASSNGDTVVVPAGNCAWTANIVISKSIQLLASGTVTITDNSRGGDPDAGGGPSLIIIYESNAGSVKLQGFTFVVGTGAHNGKSGIVEMNYTGGQPILVIGNTFTQGSTGNAIVAHTNSGVISNNVFTGTVYYPLCGNNTSALRHKPTSLSSSWSTPSTFGTADSTGTENLYFESNKVSFIYEGIDVDDNGRVVLRYNTFTNSGVITHGTDTSGIYGGRSAEVYNNNFVVDTTPICAGLPAQPGSGIGLRGGTALIHDNIIPDPAGPTWGQKVSIIFLAENLRRKAGGFPCWDTLTAPGAGYPFPHQPGWGYTTGATALNGSNCPNCPVHQDIEPIYLWNNTGGGNYNSPSVQNYNVNECGSLAPIAGDYIKAGRDYFVNTPKPGYTPYPYPHPLVSGAPAPTPSPAPAPAPSPSPTPSPMINMAPTVAIISPTSASVVRRSRVTISASASDDVGVTKMEILVNGSLLCSSSSCSWKVPGAANKTYLIKANAYDAAGSVGSAQVSVTSH